jgi:hypothetical protein
VHVSGEQQRRARLPRLPRLSGLDAYADKTFASFDGRIPGVGAYDAAWNAGLAMTVEQAIARS